MKNRGLRKEARKELVASVDSRLKVANQSLKITQELLVGKRLVLERLLLDRTQVKQLDSLCRDMLQGISEVAMSVSRGANLNTTELASLIPKEEKQKVPEVVKPTKGKLDKIRTGIIVFSILGENVNKFLAKKQFSIARGLSEKLVEAEKVREKAQLEVNAAAKVLDTGEMKLLRNKYEAELKTEKARAKDAGESPSEIEKDPRLLLAESDFDAKKVDLSNAKLKVHKIKAQKALNRIAFVSARVTVTLTTGLVTRVDTRVAKSVVQSGQGVLQDTLVPVSKFIAREDAVRKTTLSKKKYLDKVVDGAVIKGLNHMNLKTRIKVAKSEYGAATDSKTKKKLGVKVGGLIIGDIALRASANLFLRGGRMGYTLGRSATMIGWTGAKELYKTPKELVKEFSRDKVTGEHTAIAPELKKKAKKRLRRKKEGKIRVG